MNYTTNYHLPQWVESDRILMEDFNDAMETLDEGIAAAQAAADSAQSAAETAQSTANAAYSPSNKPYVIGTYTGTGNSIAVTLGFRPSLVIISSAVSTGLSSRADLFAYSAITSGGNVTDCITLTDTGFTVTPLADPNQYPKLTYHNRHYEYIAFR